MIELLTDLIFKINIFRCKMIEVGSIKWGRAAGDRFFI